MVTGGDFDDQVLARTVREHRRRAGLSQQALADMAGMSVRTLRELEQGRVDRPRRDTVTRLADSLGLDDDDRAILCGPTDASRRVPARVEVLGPVRVRVGTTSAPTGSTPQRSLLALLALRNGRPVRLDEIVEALWGVRPPKSHRTIVQIYIGALRRIVDEPPGVLSHVAGGYQLDLPAGRLDVADFWAEAAAGRRLAAQGDHAAAAHRFGLGLELWRGPIAEDTPIRHHPDAAELGAERVRTALDWSDAALAGGKLHGITGTLRALVREDPMHEALHARLMLVLAAGGEQAAALATFADIRGRLAEELGVQPGPELRAAQLRVLHQTAVGPVAPGAGTPPPVLAQLPPDVRGFAGRTDELRRLDEIAASAGQQPTAVVIAAVAGTAGVGKTALAVHWAHRVAAQFPDGQLFVNLRGFDGTGTLTQPTEAIRGFLEALGVPATRMPTNLDALIGLYRSQLSGKRVLIVLDNARDAEQVRPLFPGAPGCLVLVTSRNKLTSLAAAEAARLLSLDPLTDAEARQLLAQRLGRQQVDSQPEAVAAIIVACERLPLALGIVAARAAIHAAQPLSTLADQLAHARRRLDLLTTGDDVTDVRAVFSWSYQVLKPEAARMFRLLGLHPGSHITTTAAASLAGLPARQAENLVAELVAVNLLIAHSAGRYRLHDLLRAYATELAHDSDSQTERDAARQRLLDHYLHTANNAMSLVRPSRIALNLNPLVAGATEEAPADQDGALGWLNAEHTTLMALAGDAAHHRRDAYAWWLPRVIEEMLDRRGQWSELASIMKAALRAAEQSGDREGQAHAHSGLARAHLRLGPEGQADRHIRRAMEVFGELGDRPQESIAVRNLTRVACMEGRWEDALGYATRALELSTVEGRSEAHVGCLNNLGWIHAHLGNYGLALDYCEQALEVPCDEPIAYASLWDSMGYVNHQRGDHAQAASCYLKAIDIYRNQSEQGDRAKSLVRLGDSYLAAGKSDVAADAWQEALEIFVRLESSEAEPLRAKLAAITSAGSAT
jgi:DNA-binding SARP family transcriptional activator/tetratricopeptide (TPR) repeat protein/DNA-binding XRE family transcriptional regulator